MSLLPRDWAHIDKGGKNFFCLSCLPCMCICSPKVFTDTSPYFFFFAVSQYFHEEIGQVMALIRKLVETGCDLNVPDQRGERPLYQSACGGNFGKFCSYMCLVDASQWLTQC